MGGLLVSLLSSNKKYSSLYDYCISINPSFSYHSLYFTIFFWLFYIISYFLPLYPIQYITQSLFIHEENNKKYFKDQFILKEGYLYSLMKIIQYGKKGMKLKSLIPQIIIHCELNSLWNIKGSIKKNSINMKNCNSLHSKLIEIKNQNHMIFQDDLKLIANIIIDNLSLFL